jgi:hypothetical protein
VTSEQVPNDVLGLVTRRPQQRPLPTGLLASSPEGYTFAYVQGFATDPDQRAVLGFSDPTRVYRSPTLFPFFQQRVMDADRPDRAEYLRWLGLPETTTDWQVLSRGGGTRKGDRYELVAAPERTPSGGAAARVLARGLRFIGDDLGNQRLNTALERLTPGAPLRVEGDGSNAVNPAARRLLTDDGTPIGFVPDVLVSYLAPKPHDPISVRVAQVNGSQVPWHLRLLIDVNVPAHPPTGLFETPQWQPLTAAHADIRAG